MPNLRGGFEINRFHHYGLSTGIAAESPPCQSLAQGSYAGKFRAAAVGVSGEVVRAGGDEKGAFVSYMLLGIVIICCEMFFYGLI
jgi:hypothetical protein